ncbi:hypothetical protein R3P38DRAFT_3184252 [Favolaschia claudopus]|uniref:Uncharacterized protein n=1 Tax=Favolaschia claudopus TaxID=2862362 RepID=A0AAW0CAG9_9AGAR
MSSYGHQRLLSADSSSSGSTSSLPSFLPDSEPQLSWDNGSSQYDTVFTNRPNASQNQNQSSLMPSQSTNPLTLMHQMQLQTQQISMLQNENAFLRSQNDNLLQMISNFSQRPVAAPANPTPTDPLRPLVHTQHRSVKFWQRGSWNELLKPSGVTGSTNVAPDGRNYTPSSFLFAEDINGHPPSEDDVTGMKAAASDIFTDLARQEQLPNASLGWSQAGFRAKTLFYAAIETKYPNLRFCSNRGQEELLGMKFGCSDPIQWLHRKQANNWKADWIATYTYSNWKASHGAKYLKHSIKVESETVASHELSSPSPLRSPRKQSSKRKRDRSENSIVDPTASKRKKITSLDESKPTPPVSNSDAKKHVYFLRPGYHTINISTVIDPDTRSPHPNSGSGSGFSFRSTYAPRNNLTPAALVTPPPAAVTAPPHPSQTIPPIEFLPDSPDQPSASVPLSLVAAPPNGSSLNVLALGAVTTDAPDDTSAAPAPALCQNQWLHDNPAETKKTFGPYWKTLAKAEKEKWKAREAQAKQAYAQALGTSLSTA